MLIVDTVGFTPGILSADTPPTAQRRSCTSSSGSRSMPRSGALKRDYVAEDPTFFTGQFKGSDTVYISDLPYEAPSCSDLSYATDRGTRAAQQSDAQSQPLAAAPAARPWWMFWRGWF